MLVASPSPIFFFLCNICEGTKAVWVRAAVLLFVILGRHCYGIANSMPR